MTKSKLQSRVNARRREIEAAQAKLAEFRKQTADFVNDIRSRSVIYGMLRGLSIWKALEELIDEKNS